MPYARTKVGLACRLGLWINAGLAFATTIRYEYDVLQRLVQVTYDTGTRISYGYDDAGNMVSRVAAVAPPLLAYRTARLELVVYNPPRHTSSSASTG